MVHMFHLSCLEHYICKEKLQSKHTIVSTVCYVLAFRNNKHNAVALGSLLAPSHDLGVRLYQVTHLSAAEVSDEQACPAPPW